MARFVDPGAAIYGTGENFEELEQQLEEPPGWELIDAAMHEGIGNPGSDLKRRLGLRR